MSNLCLIELPNNSFYIVVKKGVVIESTPTAKWMIGQKYFKIQWWVKENKGTIKRC